MYKVKKIVSIDEGLSACFRQWRATHSHCHFMHGYSLGFTFGFNGLELNSCNWVFDFGGLGKVKEFLVGQFDHKTVVAEDDPHLELFEQMHEEGVIDLRVLPAVGCEKFAEHVYHQASEILKLDPSKVYLSFVTVSEHAGNHATYEPTHEQAIQLARNCLANV